MSKLYSSFFLLVYLLRASLAYSTLDEVKEVINAFQKSKEEVLVYEEKNGVPRDQVLFIAFWNFDNTILNGDATEGFDSKDQAEQFKGILQVAIEKGLSKEVAPSGYNDFVVKLKAVEAKDPVQSYLMPIQVLSGAKVTDILQNSREVFNTVLKYHYFTDAVTLKQAMDKDLIRSYVITASPKFFTRGAAESIGIPEERIYGVETVVENGILTNKPLLPITSAKGKIEKIAQIMKDIEAEKKWKRIYILLGIGNNNVNDFPFLRDISCRSFPAGSPIIVLVRFSKEKLVETPCAKPFLFHSKDMVGAREMVGANDK